MSPSIVGKVRRNQLVTTYGVGSIVAVEDESFMVLGIDRWNVTEPNLHEPRLERQLTVQGFATPPATGDDSQPDIPVTRFPQWHSCPSCKALDQHSFFASFDRNECNTCGVPLVPSRFVIACPRGHIDDFPYFRWVHAGSPPVGDQHALRIESAGVSASLRDILVSCSCGKGMSLEGAFGRNAMRDVARCGGRRPWLNVPPETDCPETPRTLQRGASNVWYPIVRSALSIPPWSEGPFKALNRWWTVLRHIPDDGALSKTIEGMGIARDTGYRIDDLLAAVAARRRREAGDDDTADEDLKKGEYEALVRGRAESNEPQDFAAVEIPAPSDHRLRWIERVMAVKRLREVRVLQSFARVYPPAPGDPPERQASLHGDVAPSWLPAMEVTGEGVFIELRDDPLRGWEGLPHVQARAALIDSNYAERARLLGLLPDRVVTPRLVLLHSLAHALINQWSLECGYPAASLRERLYASPEMRGILIYTATSDSSGSLGGIVGMARADRLGPMILEAQSRASWCSADPLCLESEASGVDSLNLAACHACLLLPEVSCEEMNRFLDRRLLASSATDDRLGFLSAQG